MAIGRIFLAKLAIVVFVLGGCASGTTGTGNSGSDAALSGKAQTNQESSIFDLFKRTDNETNVKVNKYIWAASLDILDFLPIGTVDPFTGIIVTGYGTPPGGARAYRATIYVQDPALDARSLKLSLLTRRGPADALTARKVEDAILTRARQLRDRDGRF